MPLIFFALLCIGATVFGVYALRGPSPQREASAASVGLPPTASAAAVEESDDGNPLPSSAGISGRPGWVAVLFNDQLTLTPCSGAYTVFDGGGNVLASGASTADGPLHSVSVSAGVVCHD